VWSVLQGRILQVMPAILQYNVPATEPTGYSQVIRACDRDIIALLPLSLATRTS
jgi:hypothetical protein